MDTEIKKSTTGHPRLALPLGPSNKMQRISARCNSPSAASLFSFARLWEWGGRKWTVSHRQDIFLDIWQRKTLRNLTLDHWSTLQSNVIIVVRHRRPLNRINNASPHQDFRNAPLESGGGPPRKGVLSAGPTGRKRRAPNWPVPCA